MSYLKYFEDKSRDIVVVSMGPGDKFLEGIAEVAEKADIHTGVILSGIGGLKKACFTAGATSKELDGAFQILNFTGSIVSCKPHIHVTLSENDSDKVFGGHLNAGSIALSIIECAILRLPDLKLVSDYRDGCELKLLDLAKE